MLDSILDAEREFKLFESDQSHSGTSDRYIRLNPDLQKEPPALDDTAQMLPLQEIVQKLFKTPAYELMAERIAYRLVASSFYFEKEASIEYDEVARSYMCKGESPLRATGKHALTLKGRIACRFEGNANDMKTSLRHLGEFFRRQSTTNFRPYFIVKSNVTDLDDQKVQLDYHSEMLAPLKLQQIEIDRQTGEDLIADANLHVAENLKISIPDKLSSTTICLALLPSRAVVPELYPISGFPRFLITEDASTGE